MENFAWNIHIQVWKLKKKKICKYVDTYNTYIFRVNWNNHNIVWNEESFRISLILHNNMTVSGAIKFVCTRKSRTRPSGSTYEHCHVCELIKLLHNIIFHWCLVTWNEKNKIGQFFYIAYPVRFLSLVLFERAHLNALGR